jgi:hypothetical protein
MSNHEEEDKTAEKRASTKITTSLTESNNNNGKQPRRGTATPAVFWLLLMIGCFQILLYHPDIVNDDHWFDHQRWKVANSHNKTRRKPSERSPPAVRQPTAPLKHQPLLVKGQEADASTPKEDKLLLTKTVGTHREAAVKTPKEETSDEPAPSAVQEDASSSRTINPILQVLLEAGLKDIDPKELDGLPSAKTLTMLYGPLNEPVVVGMETCAAYRDKVPPKNRIAAVAGLFNTGTNAMAFHLRNNINIKTTWQIPWGKHRMEFVRLNHTAEGMDKVNKEDVLPIVLIREPFYWMQRYE